MRTQTRLELHPHVHGADLPRAWGQYLGRLPWERSATLTFDPKRHPVVTKEFATREAFLWLEYVAYLVRRPVGWAYAVESSKNGFWHAHALLINVGRPNRKTLESTWQMRNGHAVVKRIQDAPGIVMYTTKQAADGEVIVSDTVTPTRFPALSGVRVPLSMP